MAANQPLRLFLSYGRSDVAEAEVVCEELGLRGHEVWFDRERLRVGSDWESGIEEGLKWCDKVVLLATRHAIRQRIPGDPSSTDGFCRREIAKAQQLHRPIVPVLLEEIPGGLPTSICHLQWLDMVGFSPSRDRGLPRGHDLFELLAAAVEGESDAQHGSRSRLVDLLRPLDYNAEFARHWGDFTGRQWLVEEVDSWVAQAGPSRVLWLLGKPGLGKTALAAFLCHRMATAWHLFVHDHEAKSDPRRAILSIAYQLATRLPDYQDRLAAITDEDLQQSAPTLFDDLILTPLTVNQFPAPDRTHLVVLDAVDEAARAGGDDIAHLIANRARQLPAWLRFVVTSRADPELEEVLHDREPAVTTLTIDADGPSNRADVRDFVNRGLEKLGHQVGADVVDTVVERSEGLFLYADRVIQSVRDGVLTVDSLSELPTGIHSWWRDEFRRRFRDVDSYERDLVPVLNLVIAQRAPLPLSVIQDTLELRPRDLHRRLRALGSLFEIAAGETAEAGVPVIMPAHKTLSEWLSDFDPATGRSAAGSFAVDVLEGHERMAEYGWGLHERGELASSPYHESFLADHLLMAGQTERLRDLLCDLELFESRWSRALRFDAMRYWRRLSDDFDPAESYLAALDRAVEQTPSESARLASRIGSFLVEMGLPKEATPLISRAVELLSGTPGADRRELVTGIRLLAEAHREQRHFDEAHAHYDQAIEMLEEELGPDSHDGALVFHSLAILLYEEGRSNEALSYNHRALRILERSKAGSPRQLADCINDMGVIFERLLPSSEVARYYRRALGVFEEFFPSDDLGRAQCLHNLARTHPGSVGGEDVQELEEALRILETTLVAHHPDIQTCRRALATHCELRAEFARAVELRHEVLDNELAAWGPESTEAASARSALDQTTQRQGKVAAFMSAVPSIPESEALAEPVMELERRVLGRDVSAERAKPPPAAGGVGEAVFQLAALLEDYGYHEPAILAYSGLLGTNGTAVELTARTRTRALRRYSRCLARFGRHDESIELSRAVIEDARASSDSMDVAVDFRHLAESLFASGRHADARDEIRRLVEHSRDVDGADTARARRLEAASLVNQWAMRLKNRDGRYDDVEPYYRLAIELDPDSGYLYSNLALLLTSVLGRHDEAQTLYERALELTPSDFTARGNYAFFLHHVRRDEEAAEKQYREALLTADAKSSAGGNFAALLLVSDRLPEALSNLSHWWSRASASGHDHTSARLLLVRVILERSRSASADFFLGQLKFLLEADVLHSPWSADALFEWADERLDSEEDASFVREVRRALSNKTEYERLKENPRWVGIPFVPVSEPWP